MLAGMGPTCPYATDTSMEDADDRYTMELVFNFWFGKLND
jgi:hypothetical protein